MPFKPYLLKETRDSKSNPKENPLFLIPGISGKSSELFLLADNLLAQNSKLPIYIWDDSRHSNFGGAIEKGRSIENLSAEISSEIRRILPDESPVHILGYSFGSPLAVRVGQLLKASRSSVSVISLDAPHPELSQTYLSIDNPSATQDLIAIMSYAAKLSGLPNPNPTIDAAQVTEWSQLEIAEQIKNIKIHFLSIQDDDQQSSDNIGRFHHFSQVIKHNLKSLLDCDMKPLAMLDKLLVLSTRETLAKYECDKNSGWIRFANEIQTRSLPGSHLSILESRNNEDLAKAITGFFAAETKKLARPSLSVAIPIPTFRMQLESSPRSSSSESSYDSSSALSRSVSPVSDSYLDKKSDGAQSKIGSPRALGLWGVRKVARAEPSTKSQDDSSGMMFNPFL